MTTVSSDKIEEKLISPKLSDIKIEKVELFITTLDGILGGLANPLRSSLTNSMSPSLMIQGSSLCILLEAPYDLTIIGKMVVYLSLAAKGVQGCKLQGLVWTDFPSQGFPSVPLTQILNH